VDEVRLAERLIAHDTSVPDGLRPAMDFVAGWLEGRGIPVERLDAGGRECLLAGVGGGARRVVLHTHLDVVPGHTAQFSPRLEAGRLYGRGAYDMKAALACMMLALTDVAHDLGDTLRLDLLVVPDEERSEPGGNATEHLVERGMRADFVVCGEPTDMDVGAQAKGVLMLRAEVDGLAAHGSTPWLGRNAILAAVDLYRRVLDLPFARTSTPVFARPSINLGRISGGDAINKVPDRCRLDIDIRYLPGQDPAEIRAQIAALGAEVSVLLQRPPADVPADHPMVRALIDAASRHEPSTTSVGRDGASDAVAFLRVGVPAVEFGPRGAGHHGPDEHVEVSSLPPYRRAVGDFARALAAGPRVAPRGAVHA
jgi:succinyl-diaminopimelate desuccinylase